MGTKAPMPHPTIYFRFCFMLSRLFRFERKPFSVTQRIEESRTKATSSIENSKHDGRGPS